jgi:hypothetical protein
MISARFECRSELSLDPPTALWRSKCAGRGIGSARRGSDASHRRTNGAWLGEVANGELVVTDPIIAFVPAYAEVRTFAVERIRKVSVQEATFEPVAGTRRGSLQELTGRAPRRSDVQSAAPVSPAACTSGEGAHLARHAAV